MGATEQRAVHKRDRRSEKEDGGQRAACNSGCPDTLETEEATAGSVVFTTGTAELNKVPGVMAYSIILLDRFF